MSYHLSGNYKVDKIKDVFLFSLIILKQCGMRYWTQKTIGDKTYDVVQFLKCDTENLVIEFNCNIYDNAGLKIQEGSFNARTGELIYGDVGTDAYGFAMRCLMTFLELASNRAVQMVDDQEKPVGMLSPYLSVDMNILYGHKMNDSDRASFPYTINKVLERCEKKVLLELWDGNPRELPAEIRDLLDGWRADYLELSIPDGFDTWKCMEGILEDLEKLWNIDYLDGDFISYVFENKDKEEVKRMLVLFRNVIDENVKPYPELTPRQVIDWVLNSSRKERIRDDLMRFQEIASNWFLRKKVFGILEE